MQTRTIILENAAAFGLTDRYELAIQCGSLADVLSMAAADAQANAVDEEIAPASERSTVATPTAVTRRPTAA